MSPPVQIHTSRLKLVSPRRSMASGITQFFLANRDHLAPWSPRTRDIFYTKDFQQNKIKNEQTLLQEKKALRFWIFHKEDHALEQVLGQVNFSNIVWGGFCSCFLGYSIGQAHQNKGYTTEALAAAIHYIFKEWRLHRIEANIMPRNTPSIHVVKKLGFLNEGRSTKYLKIHGVWEDHDHYVLRNHALE